MALADIEVRKTAVSNLLRPRQRPGPYLKAVKDGFCSYRYHYCRARLEMAAEFKTLYRRWPLARHVG